MIRSEPVNINVKMAFKDIVREWALRTDTARMDISRLIFDGCSNFPVVTIRPARAFDVAARVIVDSVGGVAVHAAPEHELRIGRLVDEALAALAVAGAGVFGALQAIGVAD